MKHFPDIERNTDVSYGLPDWLPREVVDYLEHTELGLSLRSIARRTCRHASTVLRLVRRVEERRDTPMFDEAIRTLSAGLRQPIGPNKESFNKMLQFSASTMVADDDLLSREARRVLRRLSETHAFMVVAEGLEKAAVMRETPEGDHVRYLVDWQSE